MQDNYVPLKSLKTHKKELDVHPLNSATLLIHSRK